MIANTHETSRPDHRSRGLEWLLRICGLASALGLLGLGWMLLSRVAPGLFPEPGPPARGIVLVLVSGAIGFLTNWLAIKMLFRPRERQSWLALWPQGLIPREQSRFARAIGKVAADRLMNPEAVTEALRDGEVRAAWGRVLRHQLDSFLADPAIRRVLADAAVQGVREHGPSLVRRLRPELRAAAEQALIEYFSASRVLEWLDSGLGYFAQSRRMRRTLAAWLFRETSRDGFVSRVMEILQEQFFRFRQKHPVRGFFAEQFFIDWDELRATIVETLRSEQATEDLADALVETAESLAERLDDPGAAEAITRVRAFVVDRLLDWFERRGIELLANYLSEAAGKPATWEAIENALADLAGRVPQAMFDAETGELRPQLATHLGDLQEDLIQLVPVSEIVEGQVMAMNPASIESLVDQVGRRELAWIQILGLLIGAVLGLVLFALI